MSQSTLAHCPHERRPGTTVCLHCRHEERALARAKHQRVFTRIGLGMVALVIATVVGVAGATALQGDRASSSIAASRPTPTREVAAAEQSSSSTIAQQGTPVSATENAPLVITPVIAEGRSELRDSIFVLREGAKVEVLFDRPMARTRRPDKFERIVRLTLPLVYGASADSILGRIREGEIASAGELLTELPERGLHWPVGNGMTMSLYPVTRPGQDGPLVVTYRVSVASTP